jgi:hypothetical protein
LKNLGLAVSGLVLAAVLAGCSGSSGDGGSGHVRQFGYDPALCTTLLPTTGSSALYGNLGVSQPVMSAYFEKRYNRAMLEGVLDASGIETQKFVKGENIALYKIPYDGDRNTCLFQHDLPDVTSDLASDWKEAAGGDHGGGYLDGLFEAWTDQSGVHEAIMVREDSSRWTLVHEMMHANFFRQRMADKTPGGSALRNQVKYAYSMLKSDYGTYKAAPSPELLDVLASDVDRVSNLLYLSLTSGPLEEIADESLLLEEWAAGRLRHVSDQSAANAAWYINRSRENSLQDLNDFSQAVTTIQSEVAAQTPADGARFQKTLDFIQSVNVRSLELAQKAQDETASLRRSHLTTAASLTGPASASMNAYLEMTNGHLMAMNNTPALREFRRQTAEFLKANSN